MTPEGFQDAHRHAGAAAVGLRADSAGSTVTPQPSWLSSLHALVHELPGLISDRVDLLSLELQRAGQVLGQIVALIVAAAILGATAWLALWTGLTAAMMSAGLHWAAAGMLVLVINLGVCWWVVARVRTLTPRLHLPATRRHLTLSQRSTPPEPVSPDEHTVHPAADPARRN